MKTLIIIVSVFVIFFCGCNPAYNTDELRKDLIGKTIHLSGDNHKIVKINYFTIIKRLTDKNQRRDEIYVDLTFADEANRGYSIKECPIMYRLYNEGWKFETFGQISPGAVVYHKKIELPEIGESTESEKMLKVIIKYDGHVYFKDKIVDDLTNLPEILREEIKKSQLKGMKPRVLLEADSKVKYERVTEVMDVIRKSEIEVVGLITEAHKE